MRLDNWEQQQQNSGKKQKQKQCSEAVKGAATGEQAKQGGFSTRERAEQEPGTERQVQHQQERRVVASVTSVHLSWRSTHLRNIATISSRMPVCPASNSIS